MTPKEYTVKSKNNFFFCRLEKQLKLNEIFKGTIDQCVERCVNSEKCKSFDMCLGE